MNLDFTWWITAIELPLLAFLFLQIQRLKDALAQTRLYIAQTYASRVHVRELEDRLTSHLLRIERKLDATSLQTAALKERSK